MRALGVCVPAFAVLVGAWTGPASARPGRPTAEQAFCVGPHAGSLGVARPAARRLESKLRYTFCVRSTAVYQCLSYGRDGEVLRTRATATAHGTAFAFRSEKGASYLLTNEHVSEWPLVTSADAEVEDVPAGCKRLSQSAMIVDNEDDSYPRDDIPLARVAHDKALDVAILKAPLEVPQLPFDLGQSAAIAAGVAVQVRGYPLGEFQAVHVGKVINPHQPDTEEGWDHIDFVIDAALSSGNSGSPVLAVSCKTGRFELVGVFHAAYKGGASMNVVVGIDQFREMMTTLKAPTKRATQFELTAQQREALVASLPGRLATEMFPFGDRTVRVRLAGERLLYDVMPARFPLIDRPVGVIEDLPAAGYGRIGRIWFGDERGLVGHHYASFPARTQHLLSRLVDELRLRHLQVRRYRQIEVEAKRHRAAHDKLARLERDMASGRAARRASIKSFEEVASKVPPGESPQDLSATLSPPRAPTGAGVALSTAATAASAPAAVPVKDGASVRRSNSERP